MIKWNKQFTYPTSSRSLIQGQRHYDVGTEDKLPSVTTILSATQPPEKKAALEAWKARMGDKQADQIRDLAANRGSTMHHILESWIMGQGHLDLTDIGQNAHTMADQIIKNGLTGRLNEVWGSEVTVYYPGLYAGATDVVGLFEGKPSIVDFKQTNRPKRREWIDDYFMQLAAYAMAHNYVYRTHIEQGCILMCSKDNIYQEFIVKGDEFKEYAQKWLKRVDEYYKITARS